MLSAACAVQVISLRGRLSPRSAQPAGLVLLVAGLAALAAAFPTRSLALLLAAALLAGSGLGLGYFGAQAEINAIAPSDRRGEVTAAFIGCLYVAVTVTAISVGLVSDASSLSTAVSGAAVAIAAGAVAVTVWHLAARRQDTSSRQPTE
jgi:predicted MFS family arabinose efflux permease